MSYLGNGLPRLENLLVKQSRLASHWNWRELLSLPNIEFVSDVTWSRPCAQCNITRTSLNTNFAIYPCHSNCSETKFYYSKEGTIEQSSGEICWYENVLPWFTRYHSPSRYLTPGFTLQCLSDPQNCTTHPPLDPFYLLLRLVQRLLDCLYPLASVGLLLNSIVILLVSTSKELRKSPTMFLILNMAACDFFMGLWCVLTATFNIFPDSDEEVKEITFHDKYPDSSSFYLMCPYMAFIFGIAQFTMVITSLFLTVERYLAIICSMKPDVRMTRNVTVICVSITWCTAIAYKIFSVFLVSRKQRWKNVHANLLLCTSSGDNIRVTGLLFGLPLSTFLGAFYLLIFLCTIPLYIHIYIVVKKSSIQVNVKREGALARKLALLVLTNLLFSTIPLSLVPLFSNYYLLVFNTSNKTFTSLKANVVCSVWIPVLLLSFNSCLNPFLFAFKNHLFKRHFHKTFQTILQYFIIKQTTCTDQKLNEQCCRSRDSVRLGETAL